MRMTLQRRQLVSQESKLQLENGALACGDLELFEKLSVRLRFHEWCLT
jgi:hypothetical protein